MSGDGSEAETYAGPYRLAREIGRGAMGVVHEAWGPAGERAAVKLLVPPPGQTPEERAALERRFTREARALASVDHPHVVRIFDAGVSEGRLYLVMEFLDGENLRERLARLGPIPAAECVALISQLLLALEAVHHAGILHRDVKPENLVLLPDGTVKLADFGVAWVAGEATLTRTGGVLGSPAYMSPEQILGQPVDRRSDLFSAAVSLYQLLTGELPFPGGSLVEMAHNVAYAEPRPLPPGVPHALARAVERGLQKSPAARFATAAEFRQALQPARHPASGFPRAPAATSPRSVPEATVTDAAYRCQRHPARGAVAFCRACGNGVCRQCTRRSRRETYCPLHVPATFFGLSLVRLEIAVVAAIFILMLFLLSPLGAFAWRH